MTTIQSVSEVLHRHLLAVPGNNTCAICVDAGQLEAELLAIVATTRSEALVLARLTVARGEAVPAVRPAVKAKRRRKATARG
jgi:hypothetical protein